MEKTKFDLSQIIFLQGRKKKLNNQTYEINCKTFELKDIFECGQCFRWNKQQDGSYIGVVKNNVIEVSKDGNKISFKSNGEDNLPKIVTYYFDLNRDYDKIKEELSKIDNNMKQSIEYGRGIRILNQDLWETIISFIISANNNIPRIKGIIERISKKYGKEIIFEGNAYYTFPTVEELSRASIQDLRNLGLGFRDERVYETTRIIKSKELDLSKLENEKNFETVRNLLLMLPGVGPKVADCILLFSSLKRWEAFPIDVWVRRVMNDLYIHNPEEKKVRKEEIFKIANEKFGNLAGIAQQYLFYWKREA